MQFSFSVRFVFAVGLLLSSLAFGQEGYNELFDENSEIRDIYYHIYPFWQERYARKQKEYLNKSRIAFSKDNALDSMPRLLTEDEYKTLKAGVEQRATALRMFLQDHYSGKRLYAYSNFITEEAVKKIISRSGESAYDGLVKPSQISFVYGPDIIRDSAGNWRILEDNIGFVGGVGDLLLARDHMLKSYPELKEFYDLRNPEKFYEKVAERMHKDAKKFGGRAVMFSMPIFAADNEDKRIFKIFEKLGIIAVHPFSDPRLIYKDDGVYLKYKNKKKLEKVGFIFMHGEHAWMDPLDEVAGTRQTIQRIEDYLEDKSTSPDLKRRMREALDNVNPETGLPDIQLLVKLGNEAGGMIWSMRTAKRSNGLVKAMLERKVGSSYSPGSDFVGDKEFYTYVEDLIRFYLNEEPIIKNIETKKFGTSRRDLDETLIKEVENNYKDYVVKKVDGRGGDSVWVGRKISKAEMKKALKQVRQDPDLFIVQKFTPLSFVNENIVDQRMISYVAPNEVIVSEAPWGRGLPMNGNGKVNLSDKGREFTILVGTPKNLTCRQLFVH